MWFYPRNEIQTNTQYIIFRMRIIDEVFLKQLSAEILISNFLSEVVFRGFGSSEKCAYTRVMKSQNVCQLRRRTGVRNSSKRYAQSSRCSLFLVIPICSIYTDAVLLVLRLVFFLLTPYLLREDLQSQYSFKCLFRE